MQRLHFGRSPLLPRNPGAPPIKHAQAIDSRCLNLTCARLGQLAFLCLLLHGLRAHATPCERTRLGTLCRIRAPSPANFITMQKVAVLRNAGCDALAGTSESCCQNPSNKSGSLLATSSRHIHWLRSLKLAKKCWAGRLYKQSSGQLSFRCANKGHTRIATCPYDMFSQKACHLLRRPNRPSLQKASNLQRWRIPGQALQNNLHMFNHDIQPMLVICLCSCLGAHTIRTA